MKELIAKAQIVDIQQWQGDLPAEAIALVQTADDEGRYSLKSVRYYAASICQSGVIEAS